MREWLESLAKLKREVPDDVLVLPSHNECFRGLHARLDYPRRLAGPHYGPAAQDTEGASACG